MIEKNFLEMMKVDVSQYIKERDGAKYLPWAACKYLLHEHGAQVVMFEPVPGPDGSTLRKSDMEFTDKNGRTNSCYEVVVRVQVDDKEWMVSYPVLSGNTPIHSGTMSQLRVHNACRRAFVKTIAERTGLGFSLWLDVDDLPEEVDDLSKHSLAKCKQRFEELVTAKINAGIPLNIMADRLGMDVETFRSKFAMYKELARLEKAVSEMQV